MKIRAMATAATAAVSIVGLMQNPTAHASFPWGACGASSPEDKVVTTFGEWKLLCLNKAGDSGIFRPAT